ncbi:unnamed protein product [marine sediment metagenome]|uniref:Uncharacterized protein n=1 Tax=marine sediment metagenome TaxID=412755 RepID=X1RU12_9ZZZZ
MSRFAKFYAKYTPFVVLGGCVSYTGSFIHNNKDKPYKKYQWLQLLDSNMEACTLGIFWPISFPIIIFGAVGDVVIDKVKHD